MNEITQLIIQTAAKIMKEVCTNEMVNDAEKGIWTAELWDTLADSGMITVGVPEELGGVGGSVKDALHILRIAGKYSAPIPLAETLIGNWLLSDAGEQVSDEPLTFALPMPNERFRFRQKDNGWMISGQAKDVPWGRFAKRILLIGRTDDEAVMAVVPVQLGTIESGHNIAGEPKDDIAFHDVFVKDVRIIPIDFEQVTDRLMYSGAVTRTVMMAGALERALEVTAQYAQERSQFGRPIHRFQAVQHQLAMLAEEVAAASMAADYSAEAFEVNPFSKEIAMAKIRVNEAAGTAAPIAHQVHGAIGFTYEYTLHQTTRRLWAWRDEFGTEIEWGQRLTALWIKSGQRKAWNFITNGNKLDNR